MNDGIQATASEWIAWLDDDDYFLPAKLRLQLAGGARSRRRARGDRALDRRCSGSAARDAPPPRVRPRRSPPPPASRIDLPRADGARPAAGLRGARRAALRRELGAGRGLSDVVGARAALAGGSLTGAAHRRLPPSRERARPGARPPDLRLGAGDALVGAGGDSAGRARGERGGRGRRFCRGSGPECGAARAGGGAPAFRALPRGRRRPCRRWPRKVPSERKFLRGSRRSSRASSRPAAESFATALRRTREPRSGERACDRLPHLRPPRRSGAGAGDGAPPSAR